MADEIEQYLTENLKAAIKEKLLPDALATPFEKCLESSTSANGLDAAKSRREKLYNLNNLLNQWQVQAARKTSKPFQPIQSSISNFKFKDKLKKIQALSTVIDEQKDSQTKSPDPQGANGTRDLDPQPTHEPMVQEPTVLLEEKEDTCWSTRSVDPTKVYGLDEKVMSLQRLLIPGKDDAQFRAIGIVGMLGIGKTTLAQLIFSKLEQKGHFLPRIWVCLSKSPKDDVDSRKETVKRMLMSLGVEDEIINLAEQRHGLLGLLFALRLQLVGKRYLIVLDDVRSTKEDYKDFYSCIAQDEKTSEKLAYGLPKECGGTVILTSRLEEVAKEMVGEDNIHRLPLLDQDYCFEIFKDTVKEGGIQLPSYLENLKDKIKEKSAGLPLAARMMGEIVRDQLKIEQVLPENDQNGSQQ